MSLISDSLSEKLGLKSTSAPLSLSGLNDTRLDVNIKVKVDFSVQGVHSYNTHQVRGAYFVPNLKLPEQSLSPEDIKNAEHLKDINISTYDWSTPEILLGQDQWPLIVTRSLRAESKNSPAASETLLGWVVHGTVAFSRSTKSWKPRYHSHCTTSSSSAQREDDDLHALVKQFYALETLGVSKVSRVNKSVARSLDILNKTTRKCGDCWEAGLLWKSDKVKLINNYDGAHN